VPTYQSQSQAWTSFKAQSALGVQESGSGATVLRTTGGQGGRLTKAATESAEVRRDNMSSRGRHGTYKTSGNAGGELSMGVADEVMQAVFRGTWGAANLELDEVDFTSITTGANTIVFASGSPISLGLRVGDVIRITNQTTANNGRNLRITGLSSTTITVAETLVVNAVADTACEITRTGRVLINPPAGSIISRYFTIEEHEVDIDASEVFTDAVWGSLKFTMQPNGIIMMETGWVGTGQFETVSGGSAPHFTSPTEPTGTPLSVVDATIRIGNTDLVDLTSLELTIDTAPVAPDVFGSGAIKYAPDVFPGDMKVSGSVTALRKDLSRVAEFLDETQLSLHILAVENESEPKSFVSIYVPNFTFGSVDKSALSKSGGPRTQTMAIPAALVGIDDRGAAAGYDSTMVKIQVANAS